MNLIQRFGAALMGGYEAKSAAAMVPTWQNGLPVYSDSNYLALARNGYKRNELIYTCVDYRAKSAANTVLQLFTKGVLMESHPVLSLLAQPNPIQSEYDFWYWTIAMKDLSGAAYWLKERNRAGQVVALWPLRPDLVQPVLDTTRGIRGYQFQLDSIIEFDANEVLAFTNFDPINLFNGVAPAQVASRLVDVDNATTDYLKVFFQNSAMVRGILKLKNKINEPESLRLRERWKMIYGGWANWGEVAVLDSDADYVPMGQSFKEMDFGNIDARAESRICMLFGIPPILIGAKIGLDRSTFSNYSEARLAFWEDTMLPLYRHLAGEFLLGMRDELQGVTTQFAYENVPVLQNLKIARMAAGQAAWEKGVLTRNEARKMAGFGEVGGGNVFVDELGAATDATGAADPQKKNLNDETGVTEYKKRHAHKRDLIAIAHEQQFADAARSVFKSELTRVQRAVDAKADVDWETLKARIEAAVTESVNEWRGLFTPLINLLVADTVEQIGTDFGIAFDVTNPFVQVFIDNYVPKFADMVTDSTRNALVKDMLQKAQDEGLSIPDLSRLIRAKYAQWNDSRATVIARTETIRASNAGALAAIKDAGISKKQWLATNDSRTRPNHKLADGQLVGANEAFVVGGERLQFPGDPDASAKETVQCRCTVIPIIN